MKVSEAKGETEFKYRRKHLRNEKQEMDKVRA